MERGSERIGDTERRGRQGSGGEEGERERERVREWETERGEREEGVCVQRELMRLTGQVVCGKGRLGNLCGWGHQSAASVFFQTVGTDNIQTQ